MTRLHYGFASNDPQSEFMAIERGLADVIQRMGKPQSSFESELHERLNEVRIRAWRMARRLEEEANRY
jgi:hypothetical protein